MTMDPQIAEQARSADPDTRQKVASQISQIAGEQELPLMFEMLGDRDWRVRKTILEGFLRVGSPTIIQGLVKALYDQENAGRRNSATEALTRIGQPAIPHIIDVVQSEEDLDVRLSLVNLLGDLRNDDAYDVLVDLLRKEEDVNVASSIVSSIGRYRRAESIKVLLGALQTEDLWVKFHVIEALGEIGDRAALPAILPLYAEKSLRKPVLEAIGKIADIGTVNFLVRVIADEEKLNLTALRALVRIAEADKPRVVEQAEKSLIQRKFRTGFPSAKIEPLIEHLRATPKRDVKLFILKVLGWSGDANAIPVLIEYCENPECAEVAAQGLIDSGADAAPSLLEKLRAAEDDDVIALLLRVAHVIAGPEAIATILTYLDHPNPMIRRYSAETIGEIAESSTVDYLLAKLDDQDVGVQQAAVNSISSLVAAFPEIKEDTLAKIRRLLGSSSIPAKLNSLSIYVNIQGPGYDDELLLASKDGDEVIRQKAVSLMGKFSDERFADQIVLSLTDESTAVRLAAIQAIVRLHPRNGLAPLVGCLEDRDIWIRAAAAQALGEYRDPAGTETLVRHLSKDLPPVKIAAIEALGKTESRDVAGVLTGAVGADDMEIRRAAILALARIPGEDVYELLDRSLRSEDWRERAAAATALGIRGDQRSLVPLHGLLESETDAYVQQAVVQALDRIGDPSSFPFLLRALENRAILDDVSDLFVRHRETYRGLLEEAWRTADSRHEVVIAAILQAMRGVG